MSMNIQKILAENNYVLEKVEGQTPQGGPQFAYVIIRQDRIEKFRTDLAVKDVVLEDYGTVLAVGTSNEAPEGLDEIIVNALQQA